MNVLGDTFGVGIVEHYSRKQLGLLPRPVLQQSESKDNLESFTAEHLSRDGTRSPDYGTSSSPPPPSLPVIPTPQWSLSGSSHMGNLPEVLSSGAPSESGDVERGGARKRLSQGSVEIQDMTKDETYL